MQYLHNAFLVQIGDCRIQTVKLKKHQLTI